MERAIKIHCGPQLVDGYVQPNAGFRIIPWNEAGRIYADDREHMLAQAFKYVEPYRIIRVEAVEAMP